MPAIVHPPLRADVDAARAELSQLLEDAPDDPEGLLFRAGFHYEDGAYGEALSDLRVVLRRNGDDERAWLLLARTYRISNEIVLAEDAYRQLLAANPRYSRVAIELAKMIGRRGQIDEAIAILREGMEANPGHEDLAGIRIRYLLETLQLRPPPTIQGLQRSVAVAEPLAKFIQGFRRGITIDPFIGQIRCLHRAEIAIRSLKGLIQAIQ